MSGVVEVEDGERYLLKHLGRDRAIEYVNRVLRGAVDPCGGRDKLWWRCVRASLLNPRGAHMPNPTPPDRVREAREAVEELREELLETMWDGNHPLVDYYGPNDPVWEKHKRRCRAENEAELDAYAEAIRAECDAEIAALKADRERLDWLDVSGESLFWDARLGWHATNSDGEEMAGPDGKVRGAIDAALASTRHTQGEGT